MGQQPNLPHSMGRLPRPEAHPPAPRRWSPDRPGEMTQPSQVPWGGAFGTTGPDAGFALHLAAGRSLPGGDRLHPDVVAAVAAVAAARASALGRAPMAADLDVAMDLLALDDSTASALAGLAHDHGRLRALVASIPVDRLSSPASTR